MVLHIAPATGIYCICVRKWHVPGELNQQEKPDIIQQPFPFLCEDIVRELLEGQKTGHSTVETEFVSVFTGGKKTEVNT